MRLLQFNPFSCCRICPACEEARWQFERATGPKAKRAHAGSRKRALSERPRFRGVGDTERVRPSLRPLRVLPCAANSSVRRIRAIGRCLWRSTLKGNGFVACLANERTLPKNSPGKKRSVSLINSVTADYYSMVADGITKTVTLGDLSQRFGQPNKLSHSWISAFGSWGAC